MITVDQESVLLADPCPHHLCSAKKYVIITEEADRDTVSLFFFFFFFWFFSFWRGYSLCIASITVNEYNERQ